MGYFDNNASTRKHRSTKNKIPPRYILTPIPPSRQTQNPINKNIDPYSRNRITQNGGQSMSNDENISKRMAYRTNEHPMKNFQFEFNQLRTDLADAISKLVNRVETHQDKVERQFKNSSKKMNQTTLRRKYRRDGEIFPRTVEYNSQNLLDIYDAGDYGKFAPKVMKLLFSSTEMSQSIIYSNSVCAKSMLADPDRM
ncbi:unnamed protein product [Rotaria socialis]|uniref:Uncharacterized protein n=2 Tax=Rotaria socialis TaxID=392032 RepID=A0A818AQF5_9BILA|nr:unnamed protein product [Rotaria socialis]CAF3436964.1 unnamed protein product [Rotaria socialis]